MVLRRIHDPVLLVQIDHRRLNIGMAQHGLDLSDSRAMVERQRRRCMAQRMGRDRANTLCLRVEQPSEARLLKMRPHHGLKGPDPQRTAATTLRNILFLRMIFPRPPQPAEERMLEKQTPERLPRAAARMVQVVMDLEISCEGLQHPGGQHHRLFRRVTALAMEIEDRMAVALGQMPPLRPRQFNTPGPGTDPEQGHGGIAPRPLLGGGFARC